MDICCFTRELLGRKLIWVLIFCYILCGSGVWAQGVATQPATTMVATTLACPPSEKEREAFDTYGRSRWDPKWDPKCPKVELLFRKRTIDGQVVPFNPIGITIFNAAGGFNHSYGVSTGARFQVGPTEDDEPSQLQWGVTYKIKYSDGPPIGPQGVAPLPGFSIPKDVAPGKIVQVEVILLDEKAEAAKPPVPAPKKIQGQLVGFSGEPMRAGHAKWDGWWVAYAPNKGTHTTAEVTKDGSFVLPEEAADGELVLYRGEYWLMYVPKIGKDRIILQYDPKVTNDEKKFIECQVQFDPAKLLQARGTAFSFYLSDTSHVYVNAAYAKVGSSVHLLPGKYNVRVVYVDKTTREVQLLKSLEIKPDTKTIWVTPKD